MTEVRRTTAAPRADGSAAPLSGPTGAVPAEAVTGWLAEHTDVTGPLRIETLSAGRSNITCRVTDPAGRSYVLRRPPLGTLPPGAHDVVREARILTALAPTAIPVPEVLAVCADDEPIGAPFYLMSMVPGRPFHLATAHDLPADQRAALGSRLVDTLVAVHETDLDEVGLADLRRPRPFVERQLRSWGRQLDRLEPSIAEPLRVLHTRLRHGSIAAPPTVLLHGDFKADNILLAPDGGVTGVLDWELSAVGDRLADLAWLLVWWADGTADRPWLTPPATAAGGFGTAGDLIRRYVERTGSDAGDIDYYLALAYWRLCVINAGTRGRFLAGQMADKQLDLATLEAQLQWQQQAAHAALDRWGAATVAHRTRTVED